LSLTTTPSRLVSVPPFYWKENWGQEKLSHRVNQC
jgi:hypothetical protein